MKLHHLGYACLDIKKAIEAVKISQQISAVSDIIFDPFQQADICIVCLEDGSRIELVSGPHVHCYIKDREINFYHTCYETNDFWSEFHRLKESGAVQVTEPCPAKIFNNKLVCFFQTELGLIEILDAVEAVNANEGLSQADSLNICVLGNYNVQNQVKSIEQTLAQINLKSKVLGSFSDDLIQSILDPNGVLNMTSNLSAILIFINVDFVIKSGSEEYISALKDALDNLEKNTPTPCLLISMPFKDKTRKKLAKDIMQQTDKIENVRAVNCSDENPNVFQAETDALANLPYSSEYEQKISFSTLKIIQQELDARFKVIAVDADNTLWEGACAEQKLEEIKILPHNKALQSFLLECESKGFLICIVSKNIEKDVFHVIDQHPDMLIRRHNLADCQIDWEDKAESLVKLSERLNLGLDSFIFIDDREDECINVSAKLPFVPALTFTKFSIDFIKNLWIFNIQNENHESIRTQQYRENSVRLKAQNKYDTYKEFLESLNIEIELVNFQKEFFGRVAELSHRTTQFNCSNHALSNRVLEKILEEHNALIVKVSDKFGDYGIVGFLSYHEEENSLLIENFFLSCRSLNKGIEFEVIKSIANTCPSHIRKIQILFNESNRNIPARKFLDLVFNRASTNAKKILYELTIEAARNISFQTIELKPDLGAKEIEIRYNKKYFDGSAIIELSLMSNQLKNDFSKKNLEKSSVANLDLWQVLIEIWQKELGAKNDDFKISIFELGATSLSAIKIAAAINKKLGLHFGIKEIYENDSLLKIYDFINGFEHSLHSKEIQSTQGSKVCLASLNQQALFILDRLEFSWYYNMPSAFLIEGEINLHNLREAFKTLIQAHPSLRAKFFFQKNQVYFTEVEEYLFELSYFKMPEASEADMIAFCRQEERKVFDLQKDLPIRVSLIKWGLKKHVLFVNIHHIVSDGWSEVILFEQLSEIYTKLASGKTVSTEDYKETQAYSTFCQLESARLGSPEFKKQLDYWNKKLSDAQCSEIKYDRNEDRSSEFLGCYKQFNFDVQCYKRLKKIASEQKTTIFNLAFTLFNVLISKYTNQNDVLIGCPFWNRSFGSFDKTIGYFVNLILLRNFISPDATVLELIRLVSENALEAQLAQSVPLPAIIDQVRSKANLHDLRIPKIVFAFQNDPTLTLDSNEAKRLYRGYNIARFDLVMEITEKQETLLGGIYYSTNYSEELITAIIDSYVELIANLEQILMAKIGHLSLSTPAGGNQTPSLFRSNNIDLSFRPIGLESLFEEKVLMGPRQTAVCDQHQTLTYQELDRLSSIIATNLIKQGFVPGDIIGIGIERSAILIVVAVALMKAGITYVGLDFNNPDDYLLSIIKNSNLKTIITSKVLSTRFSKFKPVLIDGDLTKYNPGSDRVKLQPINPDSVFYILYTSGTTGAPKGVEITYKNFYNLLSSTHNEYQFSDADRIVFFHSFGFDVAQWEIWSALLNGSQLMIPSEDTLKSPQAFSEFLIKKQITVLNQTPSAFEHLCDGLVHFKIGKLPSLRLVIFAGESLNLEIIKKFPAHNNTRFYNMYGITEVTVHTTIKEVDRADLGSKINNIGLPIKNTDVLILDENMGAQPIGAIGEIHVIGYGVAKSYHNNLFLTQSRFKRLGDFIAYKSGDFARRLGNGEIEFLGRIDDQVKLRGYRLDLKEISNTINEFPGVKTSIVLLKKETQLDGKICVFVMPSYEEAYPLFQIARLKAERPNLKFHALPNKLTIAHLNSFETDTLYQEIFVDSEYIKNGISIADGDVVFDVGANIGMFSFRLAMSQKNLQVYAFEPIPPIFDILKANIEIFNLKNIKAFNFGLYDSSQEIDFVYYPNVSVLSSIHGDIEKERELMSTYIHNKYGNNLNQQTVEELIENQLKTQHYHCQLVALSDVIIQNNVEKIDLLKIDVEKSELAVLMGVNDDHWKLIKQIVIEVHDIGNNLNTIVELLKKQEFKVTVTQNQDMKKTNLFVVFAISKNLVKSPSLLTLAPKYQWNSEEDFFSELHIFLKSKLPKYMLPAEHSFISEIPLTVNGKLDKNHLLSLVSVQASGHHHTELPNELERSILNVWKDVLTKERIYLSDNFFEIGGNSLLLMSVFEKLENILIGLKITDLFKHPSIKSLAMAFSQNIAESKEIFTSVNKDTYELKRDQVMRQDIAIIGYAYRMPSSSGNFWEDLLKGQSLIRTFSRDELRKKGVADSILDDHNFVAKCAFLDDIDLFDADFFKFTPLEASLTDPQQRVLLELAWEALQTSGNPADKFSGEIGIACGTGINYYATENQTATSHTSKDVFTEKDYCATRIAYKLGLTGPAINLNTACSTGLVSVVHACQTLTMGDADIMLAGASTLILPEKIGYIYEQGGLLSKKGESKPFDQDASGVVLGSAAVVFVLKKLNKAIEDGDKIHAIINGYGINNDGKEKVGFTAPGIKGQKKCIEKALKNAGIQPGDVAYIEAHGTGTKLGDSIEISSLEEIYKSPAKQEPSCILGSSKANFGHTDTASGLVGLLKIINIFEHNIVPPQINCSHPILSQESPFFINKNLIKIDLDKRPYAAISSFGIGGTNVHIILKAFDHIGEQNRQIVLPSLNRKSYWHNKNTCLDNGDRSESQFKKFYSIVTNHLGDIHLFSSFDYKNYDSIILVDLIVELEKIFAIKIDLERLLKVDSLLRIYDFIFDKNFNTEDKLELVQLSDVSSEEKILMIHPADGYVFHYEDLTLNLADYNVYAIKNSVFNDIKNPYSSIKSMAEKYLEVWFAQNRESPKIICGWSFGGVVAQEMAIQLELMGHKTKLLVMFDAWANFDARFNKWEHFYKAYEDRLNFADQDYKLNFMRLLWRRVKLLIAHKCSYLKATHAILFKAIQIQDEYLAIDNVSNGWGSFINHLEVININDTHTNVISLEQVESISRKIYDRK